MKDKIKEELEKEIEEKYFKVLTGKDKENMKRLIYEVIEKTSKIKDKEFLEFIKGFKSGWNEYSKEWKEFESKDKDFWEGVNLTIRILFKELDKELKKGISNE